jgi:hypothetical protein
MKKILATVLAAGALLAAAPIAAAAPGDAKFADTLVEFGMGDLPADAAISLAHTACELIDGGSTMKEVARSFDRMTSDLDSSDATMFVLAAVASYCPVG